MSPRRHRESQAQITNRVATTVCELAARDGIPTDGTTYGMLHSYAAEVLKYASGADELTLVLLECVRTDAIKIDSTTMAKWYTYRLVREELDIPDEAWSYALWAEQLEDGQARDSADYWLALWYASARIGDTPDVARARSMLKLLRGSSDA